MVFYDCHVDDKSNVFYTTCGGWIFGGKCTKRFRHDSGNKLERFRQEPDTIPTQRKELFTNDTFHEGSIKLLLVVVVVVIVILCVLFAGLFLRDICSRFERIHSEQKLQTDSCQLHCPVQTNMPCAPSNYHGILVRQLEPLGPAKRQTQDN